MEDLTDEEWKELEDEVDQRFKHPEIKSYIRYRYCMKCQAIKPPRSHHCSICDQCVLRMDHHCPWVGNCVGFKNHKYFWNFLFYAFLGTLQVGLALFFHKPMNELTSDMVYMIALMLSLAFSISIVSLLGLHTYLLVSNLSTVEVSALE